MADNDDFDDMSMEELNALELVVREQKTPQRAATHSLPDLMIRSALTAEQMMKLRRDRTACLIIEAPSSEWVQPLLSSAKRFFDWKFAHAAAEPPRKIARGDVAGEQAVFAMAGGGRILGVSQNLSYLPKAMTSSPDIVLKIEQPGDDLVREAIKLATGRSPRSMPNNVIRGLDYSEICGAIRTGSSAKACVDRLVTASKAKSIADPGLQDVPYMEDLHGYGQELEGWGKALIADLQAWRAGTLDFSAIDRTVVLASPPGLGKTTFARSLAKSAGVPFFATSVSTWFANGSGYLDSVIKQIDQVFAEAAEVGPAVLLIDELDGVPSRAGLSADRSASWWTPVVGHILLKLDSAVSSITSKLIIVGATNHPEKLDPALVRPGRLSKIIHIGKPDAQALTGILRQHLNGELAGIDLSLVSKMGEGASGADVTGWVKGARRMARQQNRPMILQDLFDQVAPPETRPLNLVRRVAIHEASHAVVSHLLNPGSVTGITIINADPSEGGRTMMTFDFGDAMGRDEVENRVAIWLSGRGGEQVMLGSVSGGAGGGGDSDLARATQLLAIMHASLGLGDHLLHRATPQGVVQLLTLDPGLATTVEAELQSIYAKTLAILQENVDLVEAVADALVAGRHLTGEQFMAVVEKTTSKIAVKLKGGRHG